MVSEIVNLFGENSRNDIYPKVIKQGMVLLNYSRILKNNTIELNVKKQILDIQYKQSTSN